MARRSLWLVVLVSVGCADTMPTDSPQDRAMTVIREHVGRDLSDAADEDRKPLWDVLRLLDPTADREETMPPMVVPVPDQVWEYPLPVGPAGFLVLETGRCIPHPGSTPLRLTLFSPAGEVLARGWFTTGHRCYLSHATPETVPGFDSPVVVLATEEGPGPCPDIARQYYALIGNRFDLVRLVGSGGKAVRNQYYVRHFTCGPSPPSQPDDQWDADLRSRDRGKVLRALFWLGGTHRVLEAGNPDLRQEEDEGPVQQVRRVRARPGVVARLKELAEGDLGWEREAARLARQPADSSW